MRPSRFSVQNRLHCHANARTIFTDWTIGLNVDIIRWTESFRNWELLGDYSESFGNWNHSDKFFARKSRFYIGKFVEVIASNILAYWSTTTWLDTTGHRNLFGTYYGSCPNSVISGILTRLKAPIDYFARIGGRTIVLSKLRKQDGPLNSSKTLLPAGNSVAS